MSLSGTRSPRPSHVSRGSHSKKPSMSSFPSLPGRPSISSLSTPMHWLSRNSSSESKTHHKASRSIELLSPRSGALGTGATVVRTPDEALKDSGVHLSPFSEHRSISSNSPKSVRGDRTLPPLPSELESDDEGERIEDYRVSSTEDAQMARPSRPTGPCPVRSLTGNSSDAVEIPPSPFRVLLMTDPPNSTVDRSKVIVTLETCTTTFRTSLDTLLSQSSYLSEYMLSIFPPAHSVSRSSSIYSTRSEDGMQETYRNHLISQGLLSKTPFNLHLFLDRPSESYPYILSYLRSGSFPRIYTLEQLLDLRDEAAFLGLAILHDLCVEEVHQQTGIERRTPYVHAMHTSVHSLHALIERVGRESQADYDPEKDQRSSATRPPHGKAASSEGVFKPPTPQSWKQGRSSSTSHPGRSTISLRSPAGWI